MCGINGILRLDPQAPPPDSEEALRTRDSMTARGPDGAGLWADPNGDIVLAHRRLSIIDLSDAGLQPMASADGRYRIVFNGEIYNYKELRSELAPDYPFRSRSDTEVILALFAAQGLPGLSRLRGMYAFGIWDDREHRLLLARDPNGIKPLYYSTDGKHLRFASQVKALVAGGAVAKTEDSAGLCGFLLWGFVPEPLTIYETVKALPAGHFAWVSRTGLSQPEPVPAPQEPAGIADLAAAIEESVTAHLVSDVPVAVFLSAGLDSSLVAALAVKHLPSPPLAITLRFREFAGTEDDEGPLAAEVARALGARHIERWVSRDEFMAEWDSTLRAMDQPSIDGFNTYWVCKAAREAGVKVALSGLGGDELLGGYPSFRQVPIISRWAKRARRVPGIGAALPRVARWIVPSRPKLQGLVRHGGTLEGAYFLRRGLFLPEEIPALVGEVPREGLQAFEPGPPAGSTLAYEFASSWESVQSLETRVYLRNQLLRDSDWASMAHSVELRVPFVDALLQRQAASSGFLLPRRIGKAGVVRRLAPHLPRALFSRRKTGFRVPVSRWLRGASGRAASADSRCLAVYVAHCFGLKTYGSGASSSRR
jgi:asparagine synthase (glutamine-hydrolysing)